MDVSCSQKIILVGAGNMGSAILNGCLKNGINPKTVHIVEPNVETAKRLIRIGVNIHSDYQSLPKSATIIIFAIKPQIMRTTLPYYKPFMTKKTVSLSNAAGCKIELFERFFKHSPVVRAMPNTPATIGLGMTVACSNKHVTRNQEKLCQNLLDGIGTVEWISDESLMDAVTAISGSGPAYIFLLIIKLTAAGISAGLEPKFATLLASETVRGAGELAIRSDSSAEVLLSNVISPGGTTAAALKILDGQNGLGPLIEETVLAAIERSKQLAE